MSPREICHSYTTFNTCYNDTGLFGIYAIARREDRIFCCLLARRIPSTSIICIDKGCAWVSSNRVGQGSSSICSTDSKRQHYAHGKIILILREVMPRVQCSQIVYTSTNGITAVGMQFLTRIRFRASDFDRKINRNRYGRHVCSLYLVLGIASCFREFRAHAE